MIKKPKKYKYGLYGNTIQDRIFDGWEAYYKQGMEGLQKVINYRLDEIHKLKKENAIILTNARIEAVEARIETKCVVLQ